jgi:hypothetical protein
MLLMVLPIVLSLLSRMIRLKGTLAKVFWSVASFPYTQRSTSEEFKLTPTTDYKADLEAMMQRLGWPTDCLAVHLSMKGTIAGSLGTIVLSLCSSRIGRFFLVGFRVPGLCN